MKDNDKIRIFDKLIDLIGRQSEDKTISPKMVGYLNQAQGINGFKLAEIGTPVFDSGDRYFIMLESLDEKRNLEVSYYKDTLKKVIDFI